MENPNTWTPLHYELMSVKSAEDYLSILLKHNPSLSIKDIISILEIYQKDLDNEICGLSLESFLIQKLL